MSAQVALLGATAAMTAFSAVRQGQAQGDAMDQAAASSRMGAMGSQVEASEVRAQAANEELQRRTGLIKLMSANRAEIAGRGVSAEQGSSYDVISDYNKSENDKDVANIRYMGESRVRRLNFSAAAQEAQASQYINMAGMARTSGWINAGISLGKAGFTYFGLPKTGGTTVGATAGGGAAAP